MIEVAAWAHAATALPLVLHLGLIALRITPMTMLEKLLLPEIRELIHDQDLDTLREVLNRWLPADLGDLLADLGSYEDI
jgi:hypothetical protein